MPLSRPVPLPPVQTLQVALDARAYPIHIGAGLLAHAAEWILPVLPYPRVIIVADEQVAAHYLPVLMDALRIGGIAVSVVRVPAGEGSKSFSRFEWLMNELLAQRPDRKTTLVALGGGVIGDLCGFAASVLLRGVPFIQIPTSLLAQIDSSVGGKTGINTPAGKNLVGSFYQPRLVLIDLDTLKTLPLRELRAGYAEMVKYGLLGDAAFFAWLEEKGRDVLALHPDFLREAVYHCCAMKAQIVAEDERESGRRALLNLGHTFAHALEAEAAYDGRLLHGEAVAIGMVMAARLSAMLGLCDASVETRLIAHLHACGLPAIPADIAEVVWEAGAIGQHFLHDKKNEADELVFILLEAAGRAVVHRGVNLMQATEAVKQLL